MNKGGSPTVTCATGLANRAAGRLANTFPPSIVAQVFRVGPQSAQRRFAVVNLRRKQRFVTQPVLDARNGETMPAQLGEPALAAIA
jgi:hypothetical protein